jgi:hypothetical protein
MCTCAHLCDPERCCGVAGTTTTTKPPPPLVRPLFAAKEKEQEIVLLWLNVESVRFKSCQEERSQERQVNGQYIRQRGKSGKGGGKAGGLETPSDPIADSPMAGPSGEPIVETPSDPHNHGRR